MPPCILMLPLYAVVMRVRAAESMGVFSVQGGLSVTGIQTTTGSETIFHAYLHSPHCIYETEDHEKA